LKVQTINTPYGERYILLDNDYKIIDEVKRFLKYLDVLSKSPNTLKNYAFHLKAFYEYMLIIDLDIKDLCNSPDKKPIDTLSNFILYLQYPDRFNGITHIGGEEAIRSDKTVNIIVDTVVEFYRYLSKNNELEELDIYKMQMANTQFKSFLYELISNKNSVKKHLLKKKVIEKELKYITRTQFTEMFNCCNLERDKLILAVLFEGGLRLNEVLGIHLEDLSEVDKGIIFINPRENNENGARVKNHASGKIKYPDYVIDMILKYIETDVVNFDSDFLFLNLYGENKGKPMNAITVEKLFNRLSEQIGYHVHPHMLRHGFATEKLESGMSLEEIAIHLRHKNVQSSQIYAHFTDELKKEKMRKFFDEKKLKYGGVISYDKE